MAGPTATTPKLWRKADAGIFSDAGSTPAVNDATVQQINDQSGNGVTSSQATGGNRPTYKTGIYNGLPVLRFTGSQYLDTTSFLDSSFYTSFTYLVVHKPSNTSFEVLTGNGSQYYLAHGLNSVHDSYHFSGGLSSSAMASGIGAQALSIEVFRYNGSAKTLDIFGVNTPRKTVSATGDLAVSGVLRLGDFSSGGFGYNGDWGEDILYNAALSDAETDALITYAAARWGISPSGLPQVVFDGDSITRGVGTSGGSATYPAQTIANLAGSWDSITEYAKNGQLLDTINTTGMSEGSYSSRRTNNFVVMFAGTNDMFFGVSGATMITRTQTWSTNRAAMRAQGVKLIWGTPLPRNDGADAGFEANRQTLIAWMQLNWPTYVDALWDTSANTSVGVAGACDSTSFFDPDKGHPNDAGAAILGTTLAATIAPLVTTANNSGFFFAA